MRPDRPEYADAVSELLVHRRQALRPAYKAIDEVVESVRGGVQREAIRQGCNGFYGAGKGCHRRKDLGTDKTVAV